MTVDIAPILVSTTMRAVTVQHFAIASITSTASRKERPWPPSACGMVMPTKAGLFQRLHDVPGVLLVAVDCRCARTYDLLRKCACTRLQCDFVPGKA